MTKDIIMKPAHPHSIHGSMTNAVIQELEELLHHARNGEYISFCYVTVDRRNRPKTGSAGACKRNAMLAGGAFLRAAIRSSEDE